MTERKRAHCGIAHTHSWKHSLQLKGDLDEEVHFDPSKYKRPALPPAPELQTRHKAAARAFDDMWRTGDPAAAQQILAEDVSIVSVHNRATAGECTFISGAQWRQDYTCAARLAAACNENLLCCAHSMTPCWATRSTAAGHSRR